MSSLINHSSAHVRLLAEAVAKFDAFPSKAKTEAITLNLTVARQVLFEIGEMESLNKKYFAIIEAVRAAVDTGKMCSREQMVEQLTAVRAAIAWDKDLPPKK